MIYERMNLLSKTDILFNNGTFLLLFPQKYKFFGDNLSHNFTYSEDFTLLRKF